MSKPWTTSRGPIVANEADIRKAQAISDLLMQPVAVLPNAVGEPIRPFALGLWHELRPLLKPDVGITTLRRATGAYLHSKRYYFATAQPDSLRYGIDGKPREPVSEGDRIAAQEKYLGLKRQNAARADADAPAPMASPAPTKADLIRAALLERRKTSPLKS